MSWCSAAKPFARDANRPVEKFSGRLFKEVGLDAVNLVCRRRQFCRRDFEILAEHVDLQASRESVVSTRHTLR